MTVWPKQLPPIDARQQAIFDDAMVRWHQEQLDGRYRLFERFNHRYPLRSRSKEQSSTRTLEIGAGVGAQLEYEDLASQVYACVDIRADMLAELRARYPHVRSLLADVQDRLPFESGVFDRVLAVHVLEHLPDLPRALAEVRRVLRPDGRLAIVIPCDPGFVYSMCRRVSTQRDFERRYGEPYRAFIEREHINTPAEIVEVIRESFRIDHRRFFPFFVPSIQLNLCIGLTAVPLDP